MSVGRRLQRFMTKHHLTFRDIERMTGVGKATLSRIINGYTGPTLEYQINRIVAGLTEHGYQVTREELLEGLDPRADFEWTIRQASPEQRLDYVTMTTQERLRLTLDFLRTRYPTKFRTELLATVSHLQPQFVGELLVNWDNRPPDRSVSLVIAKGIGFLTDITIQWFTTGWLADEDPTQTILLGFEDLTHEAATTTPVIKEALSILRSKYAELLQGGVLNREGTNHRPGVASR